MGEGKKEEKIEKTFDPLLEVAMKEMMKGAIDVLFDGEKKKDWDDVKFALNIIGICTTYFQNRYRSELNGKY